MYIIGKRRRCNNVSRVRHNNRIYYNVEGGAAHHPTRRMCNIFRGNISLLNTQQPYACVLIRKPLIAVAEKKPYRHYTNSNYIRLGIRIKRYNRGRGNAHRNRCIIGAICWRAFRANQHTYTHNTRSLRAGETGDICAGGRGDAGRGMANNDGCS